MDGRQTGEKVLLNHNSIEPTSQITIPEKEPCGINKSQIDWLRLMTSSSSSKADSLKIMPIPSRPMTRALDCS